MIPTGKAKNFHEMLYPFTTSSYTYISNIRFTTWLGRFQIALVEVKHTTLLMNAKLQDCPEGIFQSNVFGTNIHKYDTSTRGAVFLYFSLWFYVCYSLNIFLTIVLFT